MFHLRSIRSRRAALAACARASVVTFAASSLLACAALGEDDDDPTDTVASALGVVYEVGPGKPFADLQSVATRLGPGDVVNVYAKGSPYAGGVVFRRPGAAHGKITIRGVAVNGARPVITGGTNTVQFEANHYVLEGFEITRGSFRNVFHHAHDVTIRDTAIHDCLGHGILGADSGAGSLTLQRVEVYACGQGTNKHPVYMATDESVYPGAVFRMEGSYLHDQRGGNAIKSRAERNEIYGNWIEGGFYREIELIGPDGQSAALKREDSDVVGNVFVKTQGTYVARIGGDGTGATSGRYRFVNNTFVLQANSPAAVQVFDRVETLEMHNNVFFRQGGGGVAVVNTASAVWAAGRAVTNGQNNWIPAGSSSVPAGWTGTLQGTSPGFVNAASRDFRLTATSPLRDAGAMAPASPAGFPFPSPLTLPTSAPPLRALVAAAARPIVGAIDIGAFEYGTASTPPTPGGGTPPDATACIGGAPGFSTRPMEARSGRFSLTVEATPSASNVDSAVAIARGAPKAWTGLAAIVLFEPSGRVRARNGAAYTAVNDVPYRPGVAHRVRFEVDVSRRVYSAYVTPAGGAEVPVALDYAFRAEQASVASLDGVTVASDGASGTLRACGLP